MKHTHTILLAAFLVFLSGCGPDVLKTTKVTGKITFNGEIVAGANVVFSPTGSGGKPAVGLTDENGVYVLQTHEGAVGAGTTPGEYKVTVTKSEIVPTGKMIQDGSEEPYEETKTTQLLPKKYGSSMTTDLSATIVEGQENVFDFELKK